MNTIPRDYDAHDEKQSQQESDGQKKSPADPDADDKPTPSGPNGQEK